jgi:hypothetical protein
MICKLRYYQDRNDPNVEYVIICTQELSQDMLEDVILVDEVTIEGKDLTSWPTDRFLIQE